MLNDLRVDRLRLFGRPGSNQTGLPFPNFRTFNWATPPDVCSRNCWSIGFRPRNPSFHTVPEVNARFTKLPTQVTTSTPFSSVGKSLAPYLNPSPRTRTHVFSQQPTSGAERSHSRRCFRSRGCEWSTSMPPRNATRLENSCHSSAAVWYCRLESPRLPASLVPPPEGVFSLLKRENLGIIKYAEILINDGTDYSNRPVLSRTRWSDGSNGQLRLYRLRGDAGATWWSGCSKKGTR